MSGMIDAVAKFRCIRSVQVCNKYTVRLTRCATQHGGVKTHQVRRVEPLLQLLGMSVNS